MKISKNINTVLILSLLFILPILFEIFYKNITEGFDLKEESIDKFLEIENLNNPNAIFDINKLKEQVSQEELDYFIENGMWPWSEETIQMYEKAVNNNPYIRTYSGDSVFYTRRTYNEAAILKILSYQAKEGQFLLSGVQINGSTDNILPSGHGNFGYHSGLQENTDDVIKCNMEKDDDYFLERTSYTGTTTKLDVNNVENEIPGFKFVNSPCNPCTNLYNSSSNTNNSCPFKLKLKDEQTHDISNVWKYLWNI